MVDVNNPSQPGIDRRVRRDLSATLDELVKFALSSQSGINRRVRHDLSATLDQRYHRSWLELQASLESIGGLGAIFQPDCNL